jgi:hypothetical protein
VALLAAWFATEYGGFVELSDAAKDVAAAIVLIGAPAAAALVIASWWAVALPLASLLVALPFQVSGAEGQGFDPLEPLVAAIYIAVPFGFLGALAGVLVGILGRRVGAAVSRR